MKEHLNLKKDEELKLVNFLLSNGLTTEEIAKIINDEYQAYDESNLVLDNDYLDIILEIANGYTLEQITVQQKIRAAKIFDFKKYLEQNNLNVDIVKALNRYTSGSNMILGIKRGVSKQKIYEHIQRDFQNRMLSYGFAQDDIIKISEYLKNLNYTLPLYQNYALTKEFLKPFNLANKYIAAVLSTVNNLDSYYHIEETILNLDQGLKSWLPKSMILYRAIKPDFVANMLKEDNNYLNLIGQQIEEIGYTSTSPIYASSFAKYKDYSLVLEIFAPQGTEGILISPFSSYGDAEQEVLLNANDLFIFDVVPNVIDANGQTKIICKCLALSKEKIGYKNLNINKTR